MCQANQKDSCPRTKCAYVIHTTTALGAVVVFLAILCVAGPNAGCMCVDNWYGFHVKGTLLDEDTLEPMTDVLLGGRLLASGAEIDFVGPVTSSGSPGIPPPSADGSFTIEFVEVHVGRCGIITTGPERPELTRPDQIEVIMLREECEQSIVIQVTEDTVADLHFPDDVIELEHPILVPSCDG